MSGGLDILLADDDASCARIACDVLEGMRCRVTVVADGAAAIRAAMRRVYDLLLMDVRMPRVDGLEATRRIVSLERMLCRPHAPVVGLTAGAMPDEIERCFDAGMSDVLTKPYCIEDLERVILHWGGARGAAATARASIQQVWGVR